MKPNVCIALPCYNPVPSHWPELVKFVEEFEQTSDFHTQWMVVNDGSDHWVEPTVPLPPTVQVISYKTNRGKGGAIKEAVRLLPPDTEIFAFIDFDLPYSPTDLRNACVEVFKGTDICIGNRITENGNAADRKSRQMVHTIFRWFARTFIVRNVPDTQCGLKAFRAAAVRRIASMSTIDSFVFDLEWLHLAQSQNLQIGTVPVQVIEQHTSGRFRSFKHFRLMKDLVGLIWRVLTQKESRSDDALKKL